MIRLLIPFVGRAAVLWLLLRLALYAVGGRDPVSGEALRRMDRLTLAPPAVLLAAGIVVALVFIDMAALRENTFLANLGVDRRQVAATVFLSVLAFELLAMAVVPGFA